MMSKESAKKKALAYIFEEFFLIAKKITKEALLGFFDENKASEAKSTGVN